MRVCVRVILHAEKKPSLFQVFENRLVGVFEIRAAYKIRTLLADMPRFVGDLQHIESRGLARDIVVLAVARRDMHNPGSVLKAHEIRHDDPVIVCNRHLMRVKRLVLAVFEKTAQMLAFNARRIVFLAENRRCQRFCENVFLPIGMFINDIIVFRTERKREVRKKRPRGGRPREKISVRIRFGLERDKNRRLGYILVSLRDLVARKRRPASIAERHHFVPLHQKSGAMNLLENPPESFDIFVPICDIRMIEIDPEPDHPCDIFPVARYRHTDFLHCSIKFSTP